MRSIDHAPLTVQGLTIGVLIYSRDEAFLVDYEIFIRKRYFDFLPVVEYIRAAFFENVRKYGFLSGQLRKS